MNNYISYSLFGTNPVYYRGALLNIKNNQKLFPEWSTVIYISNRMDYSFKSKLLSLGARLEVIDQEEDFRSTIWRFFATSIKDAEFILFRDLDSLISIREFKLISEWLDSDLSLHIIRDHPDHYSPILAGLCGVQNSMVHDLRDSSSKYFLPNVYGVDQWFIYRELYKKYYSHALIHDSIFFREFNSAKFNLPRNEYEFIGERISHGVEILSDKSRTRLKNYKQNPFIWFLRLLFDSVTYRLKYFLFDLYFRRLVKKNGKSVYH